MIKINKLIIITVAILFILIFLFFATRKVNVSKVENQSLKPSIDTFTSIPDTIDGYSCYIFNSESDLNQGLYIGVGDFGYEFYMFTDGELRNFIKNGDFLETNDYKLEITKNRDVSNDNSAEDEHFEISGNLRLINIQSNLFNEVEFVGYCEW